MHSDPTVGSAFHHSTKPRHHCAETDHLLTRKPSVEEQDAARIAAAYVRDALVAKKCGVCSTFLFAPAYQYLTTAPHL
jgi:hypothetical protein